MLKGNIHFLPGAALLLLLLLTGGCRESVARQDARDRELPVVRRALAKEQNGDLDGAIADYEEALLQAPRAASAHLGLALLLHDYRQNYIEAIYHYRRYQALRPDSEKAAMIADRLRVADQLLAAQSVKKLSAGEGGAQAVLLQQINTLNQRLTQSEGEKTQLTEKNEKLTLEASELRLQVSRLQRWVDRLQPTAGEGAPSPATALASRAVGGGSVRSYEVRQGDSLSRIAESVYGDPTLWPRIRDANPGKVRNGERVRVGEVLVIP